MIDSNETLAYENGRDAGYSEGYADAFKKENIVNMIMNEDLSLDELGEVVNEALAKIYTKLRTDIGMHYPIGIISSLGEESYNVDVRFVEGESRNVGECYDQVYCI